LDECYDIGISGSPGARIVIDLKGSPLAKQTAQDETEEEDGEENNGGKKKTLLLSDSETCATVPLSMCHAGSIDLTYRRGRRTRSPKESVDSLC